MPVPPAGPSTPRTSEDATLHRTEQEWRALTQALAAARDAADADAARLSLALDAAHLGDWSWDARTDVVTFSTRAADIFQIPPGPHMTAAAMRELLHPDDRERARLAFEEALANHSDYEIEYRLVNQGHERWVAGSGRAWYDDAGVATGMFGVVQDVTFDRLLVHLDDAVRALTDAEEITRTAVRLVGAHLRVNRCAYATVEDDQDSFVLDGNYTAGTVSSVGRYRLRQFSAECLSLMRSGRPFVVSDSEHDSRIDDADRLVYRLTEVRAVVFVPILKSGRLVAAMAVHAVDPRQWTAAEVQLMQQVASRCWESIERTRIERERIGLLAIAEDANRAKDQFLAMLGHELRNPLSPILTALQLMKLRGDDSSIKERTVIERQVRHLTRLVDDLLDVSRIAQGKVKLSVEAIEMAEVVTRAIEMSSPLLEQGSQTLTVNVASSGLLVSGDADRLAQVVSNLLTNASKYTPADGHIEIAAATEGDTVTVRVRDTGIGIPPEVLPRVFDMFVQGRQALDRAHGGLGLGLAIVRSLVERHGGQVNVRSDGVGCGSEFVVCLPSAGTGPVIVDHAPRPMTIPMTAPRRATVLVVDDNKDAATLLARGLRMMGHDAHVAHDGLEALRIAATRAFDAAFLDIGLPVMDGFEVAARLRELEGCRQAHLIAVTGYGQPSDRDRSRAAGFHDHLVKPVDLGGVAQLVARLMTA